MESCCCHFPSPKPGNTTQLTEVGLSTLKKFMTDWAKLPKEPEKSICSTPGLQNIQVGQIIHKACYSRITSKTKLELAQRNADRLAEESPPDVEEPPVKILRSQTEVKTRICKPVLEKRCVICSKTSKYFYSKSKGTEVDKLTKAATLNAGKLKAAAEKKGDQAVLLHFLTDPVAAEMMYHRKCYQAYVYTPAKERATSTQSSQDSRAQLHPEFCAEFAQRVMIEKECIPMSQVLQLHLKYDESIKRTDQLKICLSRRYPSLVFDRPKRMNESERVYVRDVNYMSLSTTLPKDSDDLSDIECGAGLNSTTADLDHSVGSHLNLFHCGKELRKSIDIHPYQASWPPSSKTLTLENCEAAVPPLLYNHLATVIGETDELPNSLEFNRVNGIAHSKILSICQDIINLRRKGRNPTPKSMALGMTIKHLTGSSNLISLLNSFGHCTSYDSVNRAETAIALKTLANPRTIPAEFVVNKQATLVFDNIDMTEETLTGAGTTHHVNGILYQSTYDSQPTFDAVPQSTPISKRNRALSVAPLPCLPPYILGKRLGIPTAGNDADAQVMTYTTAENLLLPYRLSEFAFITVKTDGTMLKPSWTGFNKEYSSPEKLLPRSQIHYMNVIEAPPNDLATISHVLDLSVKTADDLKLETICVVFDQALYSKAQQVRWKDDVLKKRLVSRLGEFHTCMAFLGAIGKLYKQSGLEELMIESGILAGGSVNGVMSGHMYNRSLRCHKILYEALSRLQLQAFLDDNPEQASCFETTASTILNTVEFAFSQSSELYDRYQSFVNFQCARSPTFHFWNSYLQMMRILLMFIRATRDSDWTSHVNSLRMMLPYFFALDRQNYARYGAAYWAEMVNLPSTHNQIYISNTSDYGSWTVRRSDFEPFSSVPADQAIEQSVNRDTKTSGGLKGISLKRAAVQRWYLTQSERAAISRECESMSKPRSTSNYLSKELTESRKTKDENAVKSVACSIDAFINPWSCEESGLVSLVSGVVASEKAEKDMTKVLETGEKQLTEFMEKRVRSNAIDFFTPLTRNNLSTFCHRVRKKTGLAAKAVRTSQDKSLFARLLIVSKSREINLKEILSYPLSQVSLPLSTSDGSLSKTDKSKLMEALQSECKDYVIDNYSSSSTAVIVDAMAMVRSFPVSSIPSTFKLFGDMVLKRLISLAKSYDASRIDFVIDSYRDISIKDCERSQRAAGTQAPRIAIINGDIKIPSNWKAFLCSGGNKKNLLQFLHSYIQSSNATVELSIFSTTEHECKEIRFHSNGDNTEHCYHHDLKADHEEADTRLICHGLHASRSGHDVIISSPDTDVLVLCLSFAMHFTKKLAFLTGIKDKKRLMDIKTMADQLGEDLCNALIGLHAFTGSDCTSSFSGKGKKTAFSVLKKSASSIQAMSQLGKSWDISPELEKSCELFACQLYSDNGPGIDSCRYRLFCVKSGDSGNLPPCKRSLKWHIIRSNYVSAIWRKALNPLIQAPDPTQHGWKLNETSSYSIIWHEGDYAPSNVLKVSFCQCQSSKCSGRCSCRQAGLSCTELCRCKDCENGFKDDDDGENLAESDEEEET